MTAVKKFFFGIFSFVVAFTEISSWTIDLPEVRKYFFDTNKNHNYDENNNELHYNNYNGNSLHNVKHYVDDPMSQYAVDYEYQSYMEKKVNDIVVKGSAFLEGLRRALEQFTQSLEECERRNFTGEIIVNSTWRPRIDPIPDVSGLINETISRNTTSCRRVSEASEHVRRLSQLALWATRKLQDKGYQRKYDKGEKEEETALLIKLAWFLDRLAHLTGYEPTPEDFITSTTSAPTTLRPTPFTLVNVPDDIKSSMMTCLNESSDEPAVARCRYLLPLPDELQQMFNITDNNNSTASLPPSSDLSTSATVNAEEKIQESDRKSSPLLEILIPTETRLSNILPKSLTAVKSVRKRSLNNDVDPMLKLMNYYLKYNVWIDSNSNSNKYVRYSEFSVPNGLTVKKILQKRSAKHSRLPDNPFQDLSDYIKHKPGINYINNKDKEEKIKAFLNKLKKNKGLTTKSYARKPQKKFKTKQKRSTFYLKRIRPSIPENPQKDISFYVKNKPGTVYDPSLTQAALVRLGLERIFQTGNIEVVRRFGSNYNPAIPAPFLAGILRSLSDI